MKNPVRSVQGTLQLFRVGVEGVIADFGDFIEVRNGVVTGVYQAEPQEIIDLDDQPKLLMEEKKKKPRKSPQAPFSHDIVLERITKGDSPTSNIIAKELNKSIFTIKKVLKELERIGKISKFRGEGIGTPWRFIPLVD